MENKLPEPLDLATDVVFFQLLTGSFQRIVGKTLVEPGEGPGWLYREASCIVLAHNMDPDPRFIYANVAAQTRFEYTWEEFTKLPSRLSAEAPDRKERQLLLDAVERRGYIADYRGLRVTKSGKHFWIENGIVWQLTDERGRTRGQAAVFSNWTDV
ncbi:MEKHLA domain-containing protein [Rhizobium sp. R72]|uniref:MEKHLA domain-containing protein n=1 Tax=unclassified Rhizobium TaxID=2613769 RepID=UPI000B5387E5|nr:MULTISPECIES: MEKHLA domain-containing protein [unclassified Rhizobium]OWW04853.1 MEKHLA domain-containing protein [Rhizobium sp. R72]OWW05910.1 MEKHLA domain-containing protein [Rhizobium sp. R711]